MNKYQFLIMVNCSSYFRCSPAHKEFYSRYQKDLHSICIYKTSAKTFLFAYPNLFINLRKEWKKMG